ncbi:MAG: deoxyribonuclease IV [Thaumarchaeota archaeon]|nr:deoxyribonuclease IV [Nitrososphaerota archaeon]
MTKSLLIGFHVSIAESLLLAFDRANEIGCTTFQIFTRNPSRWAFKPLAKEDIEGFKRKRRETIFKAIAAHMPYLPNLASSDKTAIKQSRESLKAEVERCGRLEIDYLVAHLGSHHGAGTMTGVRNVAAACDEALDSSEGKTMILLENMAGQRNCVGARFEELKMIMDLTKNRDRVGVCFDTCHAFAAGFDLSNEAAVRDTLSLFDRLVGLKEMKVIHFNDSKGALGSALDRHEHVGKGRIGKAGFKALLQNDYVRNVPLIIETPPGEEISQKEELKTVLKLVG